jgi:hypothetical protein
MNTSSPRRRGSIALPIQRQGLRAGRSTRSETTRKQKGEVAMKALVTLFVLAFAAVSGSAFAASHAGAKKDEKMEKKADKMDKKMDKKAGKMDKKDEKKK